jgi:hypothetical protein
MKIHDHFHLFFTYNDVDLEPQKRLNPFILNKFVTFVLQPIFSSPMMSGIILNGLLKRKQIHPEFSFQISAPFAKIHEFAKIYAKENP